MAAPYAVVSGLSLLWPTLPAGDAQLLLGPKLFTEGSVLSLGTARTEFQLYEEGASLSAGHTLPKLCVLPVT